MKKVLVGLAVVLLLAGAGYWWFEIRSSGSPSSNTEKSSKPGIEIIGEYRIVHDSCQVFTQKDADTLFEAPGSSKSQTVAATSESENMVVSNCSYSLNISPSELPATEFTYFASVISHSAKTKAGEQANNSVFTSIAEDSEVVEGYGDQAYWDPNFAKLHILKNKNHYELSYGLAAVSERTLDDTLLLADIILEQL